VARPPATVPGIDKAFMIHDFTITEHYALFVIGPGVLDVNAMLTGGSMLSWQPDLGIRIALVPRSGDGPVTFAELDPFWVWHFANAYEDGGRVVADFPSWSELSMAAGDRRAASGQRAPVRGQFSRVSIDPARGAATITQVGEQASEFPRIDDRLTGRRHRYLTVGAASGQHDLARGEHDRLMRWDMSTGQSQAWDTDASIGEVIFVPRDGAAAELDGYYMTLARSVPDDRSWLYIWDAADFPCPPVAKVAISATVPNGLHASTGPGSPAARPPAIRRGRRGPGRIRGWWRRWPPGTCRSLTGGRSAGGPAGCRRSTGRSPASCCSPPRWPGWGCGTWPRCSPRCTSGPGPGCPMRTRTGTLTTAGSGWRPPSRAPGS